MQLSLHGGIIALALGGIGEGKGGLEEITAATAKQALQCSLSSYIYCYFESLLDSGTAASHSRQRDISYAPRNQFSSCW